VRKFLILLATLPLLADDSAKLLGRWRSLETSKGGIGAMFVFRKGSVVDFSPGAVFEMKYRIEGHQLVFPSATTNGQEQKQAMEWSGNDKLRLKSGGSSLELTRQGPAPDVKTPILGEWTASNKMDGKIMHYRYFFYPVGKALLLIPFLTQSGTYSIHGGSIRLQIPRRGPVEGKFKIDGDVLTIPGSHGGESKFARY